jgi:hypothetical protein
MRKVIMVAVILAAVAFPAASHAQFTLGGRLGVGFAMGEVAGPADPGSGDTALEMGDWVAVRVPFQLDALFRVTPNLAIGGYAAWAPAAAGGDMADACDTGGASCTASVTRLGLQATWAFTPDKRAIPWAGVGFGYEWNTLEVEEGGFSIETTFKGWEFLNLQGGVDFKIGSGLFSLGPYASLSIGQYDEGEISGSFGSDSGDVPNTSMHQWFDVGIRGKFDFGAK